MPQKELKRRIAEEVGEKKALYVIASVVGNRVASTVVEMVLDPEPMVLYGLVERDTELGLHLQQNPITSINYHREFPNDWNLAICFQMRGRATLYSGPFADEQIPRAVKRFHELYTVSESVWLNDQTRAAAGKALAENLIIFTVPVEQLVYHNGKLPYENYNMRQLWSRRW